MGIVSTPFRFRVKLLFRKNTIYIAFAVFCVFSVYFLNSTIKIASPEKPGLMDALIYSFNLYSNVFLCYLPLFLILEVAFFSQGKFNEYVLARYKSRAEYFWHKEFCAIKFCFSYRIIENAILVAIYCFCCLQSNFKGDFAAELSKNMQHFMCISEISARDTIIVFVFTFVTMLFLEMAFSQVVIILSESTLSPMSSTGITIGIDVCLLVGIKCYFWFSGSYFSKLLPHNNLFLQFIFRGSYISGADQSVKLLIFPLLYQSVVLLVLGLIAYLYVSRKDFLYERIEDKV